MILKKAHNSLLSYPWLVSLIKMVISCVFQDTVSLWRMQSCLGCVTFPNAACCHMFHAVWSAWCQTATVNPAFRASSWCQRLSSAHDRIAKIPRYIIIYATQMRRSNMNSLAVTFVNNSLVNLRMINAQSWKPTKTLAGSRETTSNTKAS